MAGRDASEVKLRMRVFRFVRLFLVASAVAAVVTACGTQTPAFTPRPTPVPSPTSAADAGRLFVEMLGETRYVSAEAFLAPALRTTLPEADLKAKWEVLARQDGKFKSIGDATAAVAPGGTDSVVTVPVAFAGGAEAIHVTVDASFAVTAVEIPTGSGHNPVLDAKPSGSGSSDAPSGS